MADTTLASEMLPIAAVRDGRRGWLFGTRFIPVIAGGEDDPPAGDPPAGNDDPPKGKDGTPFDADRAQRTIDQLRDEIKALKGTSKEAETLRARLKEIEDKDKSEVERLAGTARETSEKLTAAEAKAQDLAIRLSVERAARKLNFIDEDDAYRLIDRRAVEMDDDGEPQNVEKLLTDLAKAKPHLVKAEGDGQKPGTNGAATRGVPPTPKPAGRQAPPSVDDLIAKAKQGQYATF
jgi:hypothetical protein